MWQWIDKGRLLAFTQRRGSRKYLWTNDELIIVGNIEEARRYAKGRRMRKLVREALRAGRRPAEPHSQPPPLARTAGRGSGSEQARAQEEPQEGIEASTDAVARVPPIRVGGSAAEEQGAKAVRPGG